MNPKWSNGQEGQGILSSARQVTREHEELFIPDLSATGAG
jgi:hypothetical protein